MAKKSKLIAEVAPPQTEEIELNAVVPLTHSERAELRELLKHPVMKKAWKNSACKKPSEFVGRELDVPGSVAASNRIHQMQGWEMFKTAILMQTFDPKPPPQKLTDNYPPAGMPEADFLPKTK